MEDVLSKEELRSLDDKAKTILKIPENILIENAARGMREVIETEGIAFKQVSILAGTGNNGADSLALARHLLIKGANVKVFLITKDKSPNKEVLFQLNILKKVLIDENVYNIDTEEKLSFLQENLQTKELVIDGVFGIGFRFTLEDFYKRLFRIVNHKSKNVLAVDIPSGLTCDQGQIDDIAIKAKWTVTFISSKQGFYKKQGPGLAGKVFVKDIGVCRRILERL